MTATVEHAFQQNERLSFMQIDEKMCARLEDLWPHIEKELPEILDGFYAHLMRQEELKNLIARHFWLFDSGISDGCWK